MTIQEAYDKYKHLDSLLGNSDWMASTERPTDWLLHELWLAIREELKEAPGQPLESQDMPRRWITKSAMR